MGGIGQWLKDAAYWLTANVTDPGAAQSQYRDPQEAAKMGAPVQQDMGAGQSPMLQATLQGINYVRNNFVSRPISTAFLESGLQSEKPLSQQNFFDGNSWGRAWDAAQHISPGQALGLNPDKGEYTKAVNSPLTYYKPADALLPQGFNQLPVDQQNQMLQQAGMPAVGNQFIEQKRQDSALFKYGSGTADFAFSWYADPTVVGGKAVGHLRNTMVEEATLGPALKHLVTGTGVDVTPLTRPVPTLAQRAVGSILPDAFKPQAGWTGANITNLVNSSRFGQIQDFVWANRNDPQLLNNLTMAKRSAMGPRFGALVATLQDPSEVNLFLRAGMGDIEAKAQLEMGNALTRSMIESDEGRLSTLGLQRAVAQSSNPSLYALINQRMGEVEAGINANKAVSNRYQDMLGHYGELDNMRDTLSTMTRALNKTAAQNAYSAGAARGQFLADVPYVGPALAKSRIATSFFQTPVTLVRGFGNYKPHGWIDINDLSQDSVNELRGFLARIPDMTSEARASTVNSYLTAPDEGARLNILEDLGKLGMGKVAAKYGMTPEYGEALYNEDRQRLGVMQDNMRQYATARIQQDTTAAQKPLRVDAFTDDGGAISIHPNLVSRLINSHIMPDLDRYDQILNRHSGALEALHVAAGNSYDAVKNGADWLNHAWKFSSLLRLGYIPRVLGDDLGGQLARLGMASMALRAGYGVKNAATNLSTMMLKPYYQASAEASRIGIQYADQEIMHLQADIAKEEGVHAMYVKAGSKAYNKAQGQLRAAQNQLDLVSKDPLTPSGRVDQLTQLVANRKVIADATPVGTGVVPNSRLQRLGDMKDNLQFLTDSRTQLQQQMAQAKAAQEKVFQGSQMLTVNGVALPGALQGTRGQYFQQLLSPDQSLANVFNTNKQLIHGHLMRSWDHGAVQVYAPANEELHGQAWAHIINAQFAQDGAARRVLEDVANGFTQPEESAADLMRWFKTPEGSAYRARLGLKNVSDDQIANSIAADVHEMVPLPGIAKQGLSADGVTPRFLKAAIPNPAQRPDAIAPGLGANFTQMRYNRVLDRVIQHWFDTVAELPAKTWSRHPLFNQLYEGHAKALMQQEQSQGIEHTVDDAERIAETSRRLALKDTKRLVFEISHKSDAMAALSFSTPFFAASDEAWQRWARVVADRPEVVGYASKFFNVPLSLGVMQNSNGDTIDANGQVWDPSQKKMVDAPMDDRYITVRVPSSLANSAVGKALGIPLHLGASGTMKLSQSSMNMVLNGDPWFNPGQGPIVTIPVTEFVKDKPSDAALAKQMGVLPFGPSSASTLMGRVQDQLLPSTIKDFLSAYDTSDTRYQQIKLQLMQSAQYEHDNFGAAMPSATQLASQVRNYWLFSAMSHFLGPVAGTKDADNYAFYRQQYNNLLRNNPQTADQEFLSRYGQSFFVFAQSLSKNLSGAPATQNAVKLEQKYGDLIAQHPDLASLIIGPNGNGPFSPEAYTYELNNPIVPGGSEMMRTKMTAEEAMAENQKRLGWAQYTGFMNGLTATLVSRGLTSFNQSGAKDLKQLKDAVIHMLGDPMSPTGQQNPFYNDAWSKDFSSYDKLKTQRLVSGMEQLVQDPQLMADPSRSDLQVLKQYLDARSVITQQLDARRLNGGSNALASSGNADLKNQWMATVGALIESNLNFGNLYHRYLSRDLGVDAISQQEQDQLDAYNQQTALTNAQGG